MESKRDHELMTETWEEVRAARMEKATEMGRDEMN